MSEIILKIEESPQQHVGRGRAIVDPKIIEDQKWNTGQILELTYNKKTHVKLWPGAPEEYGSGIIKIDGMTRQNIGLELVIKLHEISRSSIMLNKLLYLQLKKLQQIDEEQYMMLQLSKSCIYNCMIQYHLTLRWEE